MKTINIKVILIDDDLVSLTILENFCRKSGRVEVAGTFNDPAQALDFLKTNIIDAVFLDVEMPGLSGFELLDRLTYLPRIILTTSKTDYAFTAFQYEVTDYLKKPITYDRFIRSINKIEETMTPSVIPDNEEMGGAGQKDIFIRSDGKLVRLSMDDLLYVECIGDYVKYISADKKIVSHATMKSVMEKLDPAIFLKVHRSFIVNTRKIKDIQDNTLVINGNLIPISRSNKAEVMQRLNIL
ncbi:MAG TPA: LytTR family DNA-binding domain-containing protein [Chitinophagaceae bacterium]|nr:LytTR family DNA-binding domain-containing protein [Chitinophagaceae bacterium]